MKKETCPIQKKCQICPYVNQDYFQSLKRKTEIELNVLKKAGLIEKTHLKRVVPSPRKLGYRTVFKLAVRQEPDKKLNTRFRLGLFSPGTHQIGADLKACPLHSAPLRYLLKKLGPLLEKSSLEPYDEKTEKGDLKYLIGRTNRNGDSILLTWVVTRDHAFELKRITQELKKLGSPVVVSAMNLQPEKSNAIWGEHTEYLTEEKYILEEVNSIKIKIGPLSFFQVNPWQAENIYKQIELISKRSKKKQVAWDMFSGVGPIALSLTKNFERVLALEENTEAVGFAKSSAIEQSLDKKVSFFSGLVEEALTEVPNWSRKPDVIVVNPSRRGIHVNGRKAILKALDQSVGASVIYLSCDVESFARDLKHFRENGLKLEELQGFDMLAQSHQMEWLGVLRFS